MEENNKAYPILSYYYIPLAETKQKPSEATFFVASQHPFLISLLILINIDDITKSLAEIGDTM